MIKLLLLLFPVSVFAQQFSDNSFLLYWDTAKTDTQFAVIGTDSIVSQPFRVKNDMSLQVTTQAGDTATSLDSSKVSLYFQYAIGYDNPSASPASDMFRYTICGESSIGLDSSSYDASSGYRGGLPIVDISAPCPSVWARGVVKGLATNSTSDSTKGVARVLRYSPQN